MPKVEIDQSEYDDLRVDHYGLRALCAQVGNGIDIEQLECPLELSATEYTRRCETFTSCVSCLQNWAQLEGAKEAFPSEEKVWEVPK